MGTMRVSVGMGASTTASLSVDRQDIQGWEKTCKQKLNETLQQYDAFDKNIYLKGWQYLRSKNGLSVFKSSGQDINKMLSLGVIKGSFDNVLGGVYCDSTATLRSTQAFLCPRITNAAVLHAMEKRSRRKPFQFTGIKWYAIKSPTDSMVSSDSELCCFEKMGLLGTKDGRSIAYHVMQSIDIPLNHKDLSFNFAPATVSICYIYEKLDNDHVGVYTLGSFDNNGSASTSMWDGVMSDMWLSPGKSLICARARKLQHLIKQAVKEQKHESGVANNCCCCGDRHVDYHATCFSCKLNVCKRCKMKESVFLVETKSARPSLEAFCTKCVTKATSKKFSYYRYTKTRSSEKYSREIDVSDRNLSFNDAATMEEEEDPVLSLSKFSLKSSKPVKLTARATALSSLGKEDFKRYMYDMTEDSETEDTEEDTTDSDTSDEIIEVEFSRESDDVIDFNFDEPRIQDPDPNGLYARFMQVRKQAEITYMITKEQAKVAQCLWERNFL